MAGSNIHSKLAGHQVHPPKHFERAVNNSVASKNNQNDTQYIGAMYRYTGSIQAVADVSNSLHNTALYLFTENNARKIAYRFNTGVGTDYERPFTVDEVVSVSISTGDSAATVAAALKTAIESTHATAGKEHYNSISIGTDTIVIATKNANAPVDLTTNFTLSAYTYSQTLQEAHYGTDGTNDKVQLLPNNTGIKKRFALRFKGISNDKKNYDIWQVGQDSNNTAENMYSDMINASTTFPTTIDVKYMNHNFVLPNNCTLEKFDFFLNNLSAGTQKLHMGLGSIDYAVSNTGSSNTFNKVYDSSTNVLSANTFYRYKVASFTKDTFDEGDLILPTVRSEATQANVQFGGTLYFIER